MKVYALAAALAIASAGWLPRVVAADTASVAAMTEFSRFDIGQWRRNHPHDGGNGWFPGNLATSADGTPVITDATRSWGHWLGPLGIRVRSHLLGWQRFPAFAALAPDVLRAEDGTLAMQAIEVVHVVPGSPAEGHLVPGDLILELGDQPVLDASEYRPEEHFVHKERRDIQVQAGDIIDEAEQQGIFKCTILRVPQEGQQAWKSAVLANGTRESASVPVQAGGEVTLVVGDAGDGVGGDHGAWLDGTFTGPDGSIDLQTLTPTEMVSGWGTVAKNVDFDDQPLPSAGWRCHANGRLTFTVPSGMERFKVTATGLSSGRIVAEIWTRPPLPRIAASAQTVWTGTIGNQSVGVQQFAAPVTTTGHLHLRVGDGGDQIHGDGVFWANITLSGTYGRKKLSSLRPLVMHNGYGRVQALAENPLEHHGRTFRDGWRCHAIADFAWSLPPGTKRIEGEFSALSYGKVAPSITVEPVLQTPPDSLQQWVQDVSFPIAKLGAFAKGYPYGCDKSEFLLEQTCDWLAAQQRDDGSWPCWAGYTTDSFHTAWCALALMSSGDPKYNDHVRRAATSVIWRMGPSGWTCPRAMVLIFLSELYLRDRDPSLLPAIQNAARQLIACIKADLIAGHGVNGFGYGYAGQYIGAGFMELGLALASRCPIELDCGFVDEVLAHIAEISCNGSYPYGRGSRATRDGNFHQTGGNAMHGPAALAARIAGSRFSQQMVADATKRWNAVIGDGDNSHATSSLAFIWSSLAMHACDQATFQRHMESFRYKMANDHSFDGGWLKSAFVLDFQGGEGVTGLWIRSAGMALILAAPRRALAITGNPELIASELQPGIPCREHDLFVQNFYARNLSLAKAVLGPETPQETVKLRRDLLDLPRDHTLNQRQARLLRSRIPTLLKALATAGNEDDVRRAHALELVSGIDFQLKVDGDQLAATTYLPFSHLAWADSDDALKLLAKRQPLPFTATLAFTDPKLKNLTFQFDSTSEGWNWRTGEKTIRQSIPAEFTGESTPMTITFTVGKLTATYTRPIRFRNPDAKGRVNDVTNFRRLIVTVPMAANPIYQSQPIMLDGKPFEAMMLNEAANFVTFNGRRPQGPQPLAVHEGDLVEVELVSAQPVCLEVISMDVQRRPKRIAPKSIRVVTDGFSLQGDLALLGDLDFDREVMVEGPTDAEHIVLELAFDSPVTLNGLDFHWNGGQRLVAIWGMVGGRGVPLAWDGYDSRAGFHPTFSPVTTDRLRIKLACRGHRVAMQELTPYFNEHQRKLFTPLWSDTRSSGTTLMRRPRPSALTATSASP